LDILPTKLEDICPSNNPIVDLGEDFDPTSIPSMGSHKEGLSI
jgi:hypothetical protein